MPAHLFTVETLGSLISLAGLEIVLGIDNIIFLSILVAKLPVTQQTLGRRLGLVLALGMRICLLLTLSWLAGMTAPFFSVFGHGLSGRDLVLIIGGLFLVTKSTWEIFSGLEGDDDEKEELPPETRRAVERRAFVLTMIQIVLMDIVFSLDSVITAVGLSPPLAVMIAAMGLAMLVMMGFAKAIGDFVERHPSMKVLALSFLILIGTLLVAEGGGQKINKAYIYTAMAFGFVVEMVNLWLRRRAELAREASGTVRKSIPQDPKAMRAEIEKQATRIAELEAQLAASANDESGPNPAVVSRSSVALVTTLLV